MGSHLELLRVSQPSHLFSVKWCVDSELLDPIFVPVDTKFFEQVCRASKTGHGFMTRISDLFGFKYCSCSRVEGFWDVEMASTLVSSLCSACWSNPKFGRWNDHETHSVRKSMFFLSARNFNPSRCCFGETHKRNRFLCLYILKDPSPMVSYHSVSNLGGTPMLGHTQMSRLAVSPDLLQDMFFVFPVNSPKIPSKIP